MNQHFIKNEGENNFSMLMLYQVQACNIWLLLFIYVYSLVYIV